MSARSRRRSSHLLGFLNASHPSGHVVHATTFFGIPTWFAWRHGRRDVAVIFAGLVVVMGPGRVLPGAGVHLVSDVLGGYLLGSGWLLIVSANARRRGGAS